jgi:zinc protease
VFKKFIALFLVLVSVGPGLLSVKAKTEHVSMKGMKFIKSFAGIDEYQLDNGMKILLKPNKNTPMISWQVWYKVGSRNESPNLTGIAHYLEHIMFKGTQVFGKGQIAQSIQLKGGIFNAFTGDDYTAYFENFSPENLELAIRLEADRMKNSRIDHDEVELERNVIVSELEGNKNSPQNVLYETLRTTAFDVHSYKNPVIGWRSDLDNINSTNMRGFYETYYSPDNAVAILVGNFETKNALDLISKYFGKYKKYTGVRPQVPQEPAQIAQKKAVIRNGGFSKILGIAFHVPEFKHKDSFALSVISNFVFSGTSSRLYPKLVDSGLAVSVSGVPESSIDPSIFRILVTLNPDADIAQVEAIINAELEDIKNNVTADEINLAKAQEESSFIYQRDGVYDEGLQIGYFEAISSDWTNYAKWVENINNVSVEDVKQVAKKYFVPSNQTVVHLLPDQSTTSLTQPAPALDLPEKVEAFYGATEVEPLSPEKLKYLMKITEPKFSKKFLSKSSLDLDFKKLEHSNKGIQIYLREDHDLPLIYMNVYFYAGAVNDLSKQGLAYLTSEMLSRGTLKTDKYTISKLLDLYGADISFSAGTEFSRLSFSTISKNLDKVLDILVETMSEPEFDAEELERLKVQVISRIKQEDDNPSQIVKREISRLIYPKEHPFYTYSVEERIASVKAISVEDIKAFYKKYYNPKNLLISLVGDINAEKSQALINRCFEKWNMNLDNQTTLTLEQIDSNLRPVIPNAPLKPSEEKLFVMNDKHQTEVALAHSAEVTRMDEDYYPLMIANFALGGSSLSSRLGTGVRDEKGYVYNIRSGFDAGIGAGMFKVVLGANPKNVRDAITLTKEIITKFLKEGISKTELDVTKSYLINSFAPRNLSSNEVMVETLSQIQLYELGDNYIKTYADRINAITLEQVNSAARKYIKPESLSAVIVGPQAPAQNP